MDSINSVPNLKKILIKTIDPSIMEDVFKKESVGLVPSLLLPSKLIYQDRELSLILIQNIEDYFHRENISFYFPYPTYFYSKFSFNNIMTPLIYDLKEAYKYFREHHYYHLPQEKKVLKKIKITRKRIKGQNIATRIHEDKEMARYFNKLKKIQSINMFLEDIIRNERR
jgi:hypothetical protein